MTTVNRDYPQTSNKPARTRRHRRRWLVIIPGALIISVLILLIGVYMYAAVLLNPVTATPITASANSFDGRYLLTVSDADMVGTAYADGVLMQVPGERDALTVFALPLNASAPQATEIFASNSVTSWPQVMVTSQDGERVYIVETSAEVDESVTVLPGVLTDAPTGRVLTVVTLATGETQVYDVMDNPLHLDLHPEERIIAIGAKSDQNQLVLLPVASLDDRSTYQFFTINTSADTPAAEITSVNWHPSGDYLAVGIDGRELIFFAVNEGADGTIELQQHGAYLPLGNRISYGEFTTDGAYYMTSELNWAAVPGQLGFLLNPRGEMIAIRFDAAESAQHVVTSRVAVGQSPEGFALSPDGSLVVTVDMRRTYLPDALAFVPGTDLNSLSLLTFDSATGQLALVEDYGFEGVLPEHATFDTDGDALAVVIYNERANPMGDGYVELWNVNRDGEQPALERTGARIPVARGAHTITLVR